MYGYLIIYTEPDKKNNIFNNRWLTCQSDADLENYTQENLKAISKIQFIAEGEMARNVRLYDTDGKEAGTLKDHLAGESKLIYFFSVQGCAGCYEPVLYKLDSLVNRIGRNRLLVLAEFPNKRTMDVYGMEKHPDLPVYRIQEDLGLFRSLTDSHYAYAFLTDKTLIARKFIITDKSNVDFSNAYFDLLTDCWKRKE